VGDPVLLSRSTPSLLAVSGANGRVLWWARVRPVLDTTALPRNLAPNDLKLDRSEGGFVVGLPAVADVDADGVPDYVACFHLANDTYVASDRTRHRTGAQNALVAVSGKTGAVLWRQRIAENWSQYANSSSAAETYHPLCRPALARVNGRTTVVLVEKSSLLGFDARTGEPAWPPLALGFAPDRAPDIADLDGNGQSEALLLRFREDAEEARGERPASSRRGFPEESSLSLVALALPDGAVRWERAFSFAPQWQSQKLKNRRRHFHVVADLDGDSRPEIILSGGWRSLRGGSRVGFDLVDGKSGSNRWHRLVWARDFFGSLWNVDQFVVGPDLDGDGHRELFAAWDGYDEAAAKHGLFVGALSGATGAMLWRTHQVGVGAASALAWWHAGADGWPLLLVSAQRATGAQRITLAVGAAAGRLEHTLPDVAEPRVADFDGDGIFDLFYTVSPQGAPRNLVVKGTAPDGWRRLGDWRAAADFDGDGFTDLAGIEEDVLTARSGKDGRLLWRAKKGWRDSPMQTPRPAGDFDGDGVSDVLATVDVWREVQPRGFTSKRLPAAFSGKDGHLLWTAEELDIFSGSLGVSGANWSFSYPLLDWGDLDRDGREEVFAIHSQSGGPPRLSAVSGRDGRVLWTTPITRGGFALPPAPAGKPLADFNGDQVLDAALWLPTQPAQSEFGPLRLNVVDGRTGQPLWPASAATVHHPDRLIWPEPTVADLDGDGVPEVLATRHGGFDSRLGYRSELLAVNGRDGQVRWAWTWLSGFSKMWPLVVLKPEPGGPPMVCVVVETNSVATLVALDAQGQERVRRRLDLRGRQFDFGRFTWQAADVDADGREELLFLDGGHLCAAGGDALEVRWRWPLPHEATRLVDVRPSSAGMPPALTVWSGPDAYGLDGATGQPLWRARVGDPPPAGGSDLPELRRLDVPAPGLPRVQLVSSLRSANNLLSVVRQAWPVAASGHFLALESVPANYAPLPDIQVPGRRLPWAQGEAALVLSGLLTLLVAGVPALLVAWAVRWRSWMLGLLPLCYAGLSLLLPWRATIPAVILFGYAVWLGAWAGRARRWPVVGAATVYAGLAAAIFAGSLMAPSRLIAPAGLWSLQAAIIGLPGLAFWALCGWAIKERRWRLLAWLFGASVFAALLAAVLSLWSDWYIRAPDERYSWRGAYLIWFVGVMVAGLAGVVILGGGQVVQWLRRRGRKSAPAVAA
jgi:outer membrane protein assembly factor BamB